ncbi:hypothetical protein CH63R_01632 [Colletotrichum higginsianum IMI 349063]|uniref:Uncharacterized protein n=1 Tax=Colletotrichum higginsianum (strain IMI 349063) TaxID=759273 RepID=A0A1B7YWX5_COLHI|nr:hypothetical protein CH63R_01632 [Colletotrichum higginsianum IMI 349063]OBR16452.1 hypothetical protein CH63R_01632 [Colletotrichum higginsianum IMI 349063]
MGDVLRHSRDIASQNAAASHDETEEELKRQACGHRYPYRNLKASIAAAVSGVAPRPGLLVQPVRARVWLDGVGSGPWLR